MDIGLSRLWLAAGLTGAMALTACADMNRSDRATATGAAVGGVAGAVLTDSAAGAAVGAVVGGVVGNEVEKKKAK